MVTLLIGIGGVILMVTAAYGIGKGRGRRLLDADMNKVFGFMAETKQGAGL